MLGLPSTGAAMVNILKMGNGFTSTVTDFSLWMPVEDEKKAKSILPGFSVQIPNIHFYPKQKGRVKFIFSAVRAAKSEHQVVYTRAVEVAFLANVFRVTNLLELHSPHLERNWLVRILLRFVLHSKKTIKIVSISEALKRILVDIYHVDESRVTVLHDGSDLNNNFKTQSENITNVGYIGHLYPGRGIEIILQLAEKFPALVFHIVGGELEAVGYWKGKSPSNVRFYGHLSHNEAGIIRQSMDVLLAPYQTSTKTQAGVDSTQWMSPIKIFEYMASGIPFICSDLPVLREVLQHKKNVMFSVAHDVIDWEKNLNLLLNDKSLRNEIAKNGLIDIQTKYSWKKRAEEIVSIINRDGRD